jgi:hypothetical protein
MAENKKYRKKPVVIDAIQFFEDEYIKDSSKYPTIRDHASLSGLWGSKSAKDGRYYIPTLEGHMLVSEGDFIITGVMGETYPCKENIFYETYEEVTYNG